MKKIVIKNWQKLVIVLLVIVMPVSAVMMSSLQTKAGKTASIMQEVTVQREAIAGFTEQSELFSQTILDLQGDESTMYSDDIEQSKTVQEVLEQSQALVASLYNIFEVVQSASYIDQETIVFLNDFAEQMQSFVGEENGRTARADYNSNHIIYQNIWFVSIPIGVHFSPSLCGQLVAAFGAGAGLAGIISYITSATGVGAMVAGAIAAILGFYAGLFGLCAVNKGCDIYFIGLVPIPCF
ncbi:MAG: hypothetical protein LBU60_05665 [Clostridiales bacterium]|jgi:hypothetical protein|nr:hypothetical protein [Clostridiales bacterium]